MHAALRERFPRWLDVEQASIKKLEGVLQPGGLQGQRARYVKDLLAARARGQRATGRGRRWATAAGSDA